jgi:hypothetical protein
VIRISIAWGLAGLLLLVPVAAGTVSRAPQLAAPSPIDVRSGDRIVFIGGAFVEREYRVGLIETALTLAHADKRLTFRNLGWSGDTVRGEARAYFGEPAEGYKGLLTSVADVRPDIVFLAYGANEAFAGEEGLTSFVAQYERLLNDLASPGRRIVLLTPLPVDRATSPLPPAAVTARNQALARYATAVTSLAKTRGLASIDLFSAMRAPVRAGSPPLFAHGMELTEAGYLAVARQIALGTNVSRRFDEFDQDWLDRAGNRRGPVHEQWASIRTLVVQKNELFFHRWRPANVTYLYLFRQREQGNNAVEIARFDPLIEEKERAIAGLVASIGRQAEGGR